VPIPFVPISYDAGFRLLGLQHFSDNAAGGSAHGAQRRGLTAWGAAAVAAAEARGLAVDTAHSSEAVLWDVLALASKPLLVSHTGVAARCPGTRTLPDDLVRAVAAQGVRALQASLPRTMPCSPLFYSGPNCGCLGSGRRRRRARTHAHALSPRAARIPLTRLRAPPAPAARHRA
jgi:hypothetical protein